MDLRIEKLSAHHETSEFDCGSYHLNRYLNLFALTNGRANLAQTYILANGKQVIAYYSLVVGQV